MKYYPKWEKKALEKRNIIHEKKNIQHYQDLNQKHRKQIIKRKWKEKYNEKNKIREFSLTFFIGFFFGLNNVNNNYYYYHEIGRFYYKNIRNKYYSMVDMCVFHLLHTPQRRIMSENVLFRMPLKKNEGI